MRLISNDDIFFHAGLKTCNSVTKFELPKVQEPAHFKDGYEQPFLPVNRNLLIM